MERRLLAEKARRASTQELTRVCQHWPLDEVELVHAPTQSVVTDETRDASLCTSRQVESMQFCEVLARDSELEHLSAWMTCSNPIGRLNGVGRRVEAAPEVRLRSRACQVNSVAYISRCLPR